MKQNALIDSIDVSTRRKRRRATKLAVELVARIHLAEFQYMERIPVNLQGSAVYDAADEAIDYLFDAICSLEYAYDL